MKYTAQSLASAGASLPLQVKIARLTFGTFSMGVRTWASARDIRMLYWI